MQHANQVTRVDVLLHKCFRQITQPNPAPAGIKCLINAIDDELPTDLNILDDTFFFELPSVDTTVSGESHVDAVMADKLVGFTRRHMCREVSLASLQRPCACQEQSV